jgi:transposase
MAGTRITSVESLPDDAGALKALVVSLVKDHDEAMRTMQCRMEELQVGQRRLEQRTQELELDKRHLELEKLRLEMELLKLRKWTYGPRADRLSSTNEVNQMLLEFGRDLEARPVEQDDAVELVGADEQIPTDAPRRIRKKSGRRNLASFDQLPVQRCEHDLTEDQKPCPCCGEMRQRIGEETTWQLEYIPGHFERIEHVRFKYGCSACDRKARGAQIELADKPRQSIDKGLPGPGLLACVIAGKFSDYLPLYRLEGIFSRVGVEIARGTMSLWCRDVADLARPLYELMVSGVLQSHVIATDDTPMPMLVKGRGKTQQARVWTYVGDDDHPYNIFDFTPGRSRDGPTRFLGGYKQVLLADAYGGYDGIVVREGITRAGCWAHARRKFVDAEASKPEVAKEAVELIGRLYAVEDAARGLDADSRLALRQEKSLPVLEALRDRLHTWRERLVPKHPMAQAAQYTLNQWETLMVFAGDGAVPIDNNTAEREMKRMVLNRKNSLFVGGPRGGTTAAILASLTSTCRRHDIDPQRYLTQLLTNLPETKINELDQWLPDQWKRRNTPPAGGWG